MPRESKKTSKRPTMAKFLLPWKFDVPPFESEVNIRENSTSTHSRSARNTVNNQGPRLSALHSQIACEALLPQQPAIMTEPKNERVYENMNTNALVDGASQTDEFLTANVAEPLDPINQDLASVGSKEDGVVSTTTVSQPLASTDIQPEVSSQIEEQELLSNFSYDTSYSEDSNCCYASSKLDLSTESLGVEPKAVVPPSLTEVEDNSTNGCFSCALSTAMRKYISMVLMTSDNAANAFDTAEAEEVVSVATNFNEIDETEEAEEGNELNEQNLANEMFLNGIDVMAAGDSHYVMDDATLFNYMINSWELDSDDSD